MNRYFGKYRGQVTANVDPKKLGRVQVDCPAVLDAARVWAMPCSPYAGAGVGWFAVPPVGAKVWVEFEGGDIDCPIVAGCFWGSNESPSPNGAAETKVLKTDGLTLTIDDTPGSGGVTLQVASPVVTSPLTITLDGSGIALTNGSMSVKLGLASVSLNDGALEVV